MNTFDLGMVIHLSLGGPRLNSVEKIIPPPDVCHPGIDMVIEPLLQTWKTTTFFKNSPEYDS